MRAIDYATKLLKQVLKTDLSLVGTTYICAIGAGLNSAYDIATFLENPNEASVARVLSELTKKGYIGWTEDELSGTRLYSLTEKGKDALINLFSFLPNKEK